MASGGASAADQVAASGVAGGDGGPTVTPGDKSEGS